MKSNAILAAVLFLVAQAVPQNTRKAQSEAECKFSGGRSIFVTYSLSERVGSTRLRTTEDLVTDGINIPAGDYALHPTRDPRDNWSLEIAKLGTSKHLRLPSAAPLSATRPSSPVRGFKVTFDHTGGSCKMQWDSAESNVLFSLDFAAKNADIPVLP
jgi:hypothetical protein